MIIDTLENAEKYVALNHRFATAFAMLSRANVAEASEGRLEIDGEEIYANVIKGQGRTPEEGKLETHDKYIDIQYVISGTDTIGWKPRHDLVNPVNHPDPRNDVAFYEDEPATWTDLKPGMFAICFPEDGHMPMISRDVLHKVVVKVAI